MITGLSSSTTSAARLDSVRVPRRGSSTFSAKIMSRGVKRHGHRHRSNQRAGDRGGRGRCFGARRRIEQKRIRHLEPRQRQKSRHWSRPMPKTLPSTSRTTNLITTRRATKPAIKLGLAAINAKSREAPTAMKKQTQQQAFEGLDIAFQFVTIFAVGEHHTGQETCPKRGSGRLGSSARRCR